MIKRDFNNPNLSFVMPITSGREAGVSNVNPAGFWACSFMLQLFLAKWFLHQWGEYLDNSNHNIKRFRKAIEKDTD